MSEQPSVPQQYDSFKNLWDKYFPEGWPTPVRRRNDEVPDRIPSHADQSTRFRRLKLRVNVFFDDYAVELQTLALILAGAYVGKKIIDNSNKHHEEAMRQLSGIGAEIYFGNDEAAFRSEREWNDRNFQRQLITDARKRGENFEYYAGLGPFFPRDIDDKD